MRTSSGPVRDPPRRYPPAILTIRPATSADQEVLGRFGGALMRQHHTTDPRRFIQVDPDGLVVVAESSGTAIGGFRPTMIEMTLDRDTGVPSHPPEGPGTG